MRRLLPSLLVWLALPGWAELDYPPEVKPIVEQRCMVCHGCYDAPCQLKLDAYLGLQRGATSHGVYDGTRLLQTAPMTRLYEDESTVAGWRQKDFWEVVNTADPARGNLLRMLELKRENPLPGTPRLPDSFDLKLDRDQQCPKPSEFDQFAQDHPLWGMPYAMPSLSDTDYQALRSWVLAGAPGIQVAPSPAAERSAIADWEAFFNGPSFKEQLMSRYIFEHLYIGHLYFDELGTPSRYYRLVRSTTPPGEPIELVVTRRPYDDPKTESFYYRLQHRQTAVLDKRHMPYALNAARMARWSELFLRDGVQVAKLPGYQTGKAYNPYEVFEALPVTSRYKFMLDEARFTIQAFIKGPVCRGQVALNVIDDHFWVAFVEPNTIGEEWKEEFYALEADNLELPGGREGLLVSLLDWQNYAAKQKVYLRHQAKALNYLVGEGMADMDFSQIWDGNGSNDNATLTVFRHYDSATVVKGFVGETPKTAWLIGYSLLERIHYLLVAGFDVYGRLGHQLQRRLYMDFLRMEGENTFLLFLPKAERKRLRNYWYRDAGDHVRDFIASRDLEPWELETDIEYATDNPKQELLERIRARAPSGMADGYFVANPPLARLNMSQGAYFRYLPEVSFLDVLRDDGESIVYTLVHNRMLANNAQMFDESDRRLPEEDRLTVLRGFLGAYPNMFFQVHERELDDFVSRIEKFSRKADYTALVDRYGVRRNQPWFWAVSDKLQARYRREQPIEAGLWDLNRYHND